MKKFNIIKKSRKNSEDIDEKIEYLDKECQKTGLNEITMSTSGIYQGTTRVPNQDYSDFESTSQGGQGLAISAADGNNVGNADVGVHLGLEGVALSPPHPVTGVRINAVHVRDGLGGTQALRPGAVIKRGFGDNAPDYTMGSALWFYDSDHDNGVGQPVGKWCNYEWGNFDNLTGWGFWDTVKTGQFAGVYFFNTNLSQHPCASDGIADKVASLSFGTNGIVGPPQTIVLVKNDLDDPLFIPIDTMSSQAYQYLYGRATGTNVAGYPSAFEQQILRNQLNAIMKSQGIEAARREQQRLMQMYGIHFPLASNPNQPPSPFAGAGEGEMFAFFGGNKGNQGFDPTKKQSRRDTINLINAVNSGDPLYLPPGVTMDQAREFVRNRDNGNLTEKFKLRNFKPNVKVDNDDTKKFSIIKKSRKKSKGIDEKIEYLEKECQKTGLQEIMSTSGMYQGTTKVPNQDYNDFNGLSQGGYGLALSGADGFSLGNGMIGVHPSSGISGVALSPPHPVTGVRKVASTVVSSIGSNRSLRPGIGTRVRGTNNDGSPRIIKDGSALWFFDSNYSLGGIQGRWLNFEWLDGRLGFWDTNFLGFFFHNTNLDQFQLFGNNVGTEIKNKIAGINFGTNGDLGPPETIVLTQNDLGDPGFLPINIPDLSKQAFDYLKGMAQQAIEAVGNFAMMEPQDFFNAAVSGAFPPNPENNYAPDIAGSIASNEVRTYENEDIPDEHKEKLIQNMDWTDIGFNIPITSSPTNYSDDNFYVNDDGKVTPHTPESKINFPPNTATHGDASGTKGEEQKFSDNPLGKAGEYHFELVVPPDGSEPYFNYEDHAYYNPNSADTGEVPTSITQVLANISQAAGQQLPDYPEGIKGDVVKKVKIPLSDAVKINPDIINSPKFKEYFK